jgi:hypothetical protein
MPKMTLHIHYTGREEHEIDTPEDIVAEKFISELLSGLRLAATDDDGKSLVWEAYDKDSGRTLDPGKTLGQNGVLDGHRLYLRQPRPVVVDPKMRWLLWIALAMIPAAAIGSYLVADKNGKNQVNSAKSATAAIQLELASTNATLTSAKAAKDAEDAELAKTKTDLADAIAKLAASPDVAKAVAAVAAKDKLALTKAQAETAAQKNLVAAGNQKLQSNQSQITTLQQNVTDLQKQLADEKAKKHFGILTWTGEAKKNSVISITGNKPNVGSLTGDALPGAACTVQAAERDRVSIATQPSQANNWSNVSFRMAEGGVFNGKTTVTLIWTAK